MNPLGRITSSRRVIPEIDTLRFFAISSVFLYHIDKYYELFEIPEWKWFHSVFHFGRFGVQLFFMISGFLVSLPFVQHYLHGAAKPSLNKYAMRRVTRIEPPYLLNLVILFVPLALMHKPDVFRHLLASLTYSHNLIFGEFSTINGVAWSLEVEIQFYLLCPLICMVFLFRKHRLILLSGILAGCLIQLVPAPKNLQLSWLWYAQYFLIGMLVADFYSCGQFKFPRWLKNSILGTIGGMCYSIYLWHTIAISFAGKITHSPYLLTILCFMLTAIASLGYFVCVERPFMRLGISVHNGVAKAGRVRDWGAVRSNDEKSSGSPACDRVGSPSRSVVGNS
jgi:peptidoglycan/LPS O-acetylase OafA/YrhL